MAPPSPPALYTRTKNQAKCITDTHKRPISQG